MIVKRGYNTNEAAAYIGSSPSYLQKGRMVTPTDKEFDVPEHTRIGSKKVIYLKEDLDAWLDRHKAATVNTGAVA